jgi:hypothetical protein
LNSTTALLPDIRRLEGGHQHFQRTGAIHFFTHDLLDFAQGPQPQWHEGVKAAS